MSLKNIKMGKQNFNPLKLVLMADNELIHDLFPVRTHVADVFRELSAQKLYDIAAADKNDIISTFDDIIPKGAKFQGINFSHLDIHKEDLRRIEFRYTGGKDYSERGKLMEWTVHRFAFALMASFNDKFMQKEYLKEITKVLDKHVKKSFPNQFRSFVEMRNFT